MLLHQVAEDDLVFDEAEIAFFPAVPPPREAEEAFPQLTIMEYKELAKLLHVLDTRLQVLSRTWDDAVRSGRTDAMRLAMNAILALRGEVRDYTSRGTRAFIDRIILAEPGWLLLRPWHRRYLDVLLRPHLPEAEAIDIVAQLFTPRSYASLSDEAWDVIIRVIEALVALDPAERTFGSELGPAILILAECLTMTHFSAHHVRAVIGIVSVSPPHAWRDELFALSSKVGGTAAAVPETHRQLKEDA